MNAAFSTKPSWLDKRRFERRQFILCLSFFFLVLPSCASTPYVTHTKKSGVEQLLVSRAVDRALGAETLNLGGAKIFVDIASLTPKENAYFKKAMEHQFLKKGGLITEEKKEADLIVSVLVKSAGTDGEQYFFGIPPLPVPVINLTTPQISVISGSTQKGYAEIEVLLLSADQGMKEKVAPLIGKTYFDQYTILFIPITLEDIY